MRRFSIVRFIVVYLVSLVILWALIAGRCLVNPGITKDETLHLPLVLWDKPWGPWSLIGILVFFALAAFEVARTKPVRPKWVHPELQEGETLLGNYDVDTFNLMDWKTRRLGSVAYFGNTSATRGKRRMFPVFVQKAEMEEVGRMVD